MTNFTLMWLSVLSIMVGALTGYYAPEYLLLVIPIYVGCIIYAKVKIETITEKEAVRKLADPMDDGYNLDIIIGGRDET